MQNSIYKNYCESYVPIPSLGSKSIINKFALNFSGHDFYHSKILIMSYKGDYMNLKTKNWFINIYDSFCFHRGITKN